MPVLRAVVRLVAGDVLMPEIGRLLSNKYLRAVPMWASARQGNAMQGKKYAVRRRKGVEWAFKTIQSDDGLTATTRFNTDQQR